MDCISCLFFFCYIFTGVNEKREYPTTIYIIKNEPVKYGLLATTSSNKVLLTSGMHTDFALSLLLKVMISTCQHVYDNQSFTGKLNKLIFVRVYDSWILSLPLFTLDIYDW